MFQSVSALALEPRMAVFGDSVQAWLRYGQVSRCQSKYAFGKSVTTLNFEIMQ